MHITRVIVYKQQEVYIWVVRRAHLSWVEENGITWYTTGESVFWGAWFCFPLYLTQTSMRPRSEFGFSWNIELATFLECPYFQLAKLNFNSHFASLQAWVLSPVGAHLAPKIFNKVSPLTKSPICWIQSRCFQVWNAWLCRFIICLLASKLSSWSGGF